MVQPVLLLPPLASKVEPESSSSAPASSEEVVEEGVEGIAVEASVLGIVVALAEVRGVLGDALEKSYIVWYDTEPNLQASKHLLCCRSFFSSPDR